MRCLFPFSEVLPAGESVTVVMGIDFCDSTQAANFQLWWETNIQSNWTCVSIDAVYFLTLQYATVQIPVYTTKLFLILLSASFCCCCFFLFVFFISTHTRKFFVSIQPPVGELMMPVFLTENEFKKEQGEMIRCSSDSDIINVMCFFFWFIILINFTYTKPPYYEPD